MPQLTRRRAATLARLSDAAIEEFARNGIDATSIEQLCEAAGFTRGAFYSNFSSKDDFCLALGRRIAEEAVENLKAWLNALPAEIPGDDVIATLLGSQNVSVPESLTIRELDLRASRSGEFGEGYRAIQMELWEEYSVLVREAMQRAGFEITIGMDDLLHILTALYEYPDDRVPPETGRSMRLMTLVLGAFARASQ